MSDAGQALARTLQAPLPPGFDTVDDADLARLHGFLTKAVEHRSTSLDDAITGSLKHTPRLMRPAVKKALGL
ncbi:hypothetical protein JGU71_08970 [Antrihabitans sp. YC3-6]|uniref:Uncharacterized protein n=1 Tax=Antrihabitans stalagmiti TaxID=2799499 RepID=A0A934U277_9NOCA|nr:hypothetical protein [Antrihabitans stalagmiti]MBJ8339014.1 hypothetical protein [Antrihabitans stalagmiti]